MSADNFTGQFISSTYQRLLQLSDNGDYVTDGTGSVVDFLPVTASYVLNGGSVVFPYTGSAIISGSLTVTGSVYAPSITGSLYGTASWAINALTASYASAASDILVTVLNQSGVQINKGAVVHISSSNNSSDTPRVALADWTNDSLSANTLGLATTNIANGAVGQVLTEGLFLGYDTSTPGWVSGQLLYLSSSGTITGSTPHAPLHAVRLGQVVRVQSNNGSIYVKVDNGYEIDELHDVKVTSAAVGDLLVRSSSVWINSKVLTGSYTLSGSLTTNDGVSVQSLTASFVSASSITGSLFGTASWAIRAVTSSYALQAQNATIADIADTANQSDNVLVKGYDAHENGVVYPFLMPKNLDIPANSQGYSSLVNNSDFVYTSFDSGTPAFSMPISTSIFIIGVQGQNSASLVVHGEVKATKFTTLTNTIEFTDLIVTGSRAALLTLGVSSSNLVISGGGLISNVTGSLFGTSSWATNALTASFVTTAQTASYILNAVSSSFALTASYAMNAGGSSIDTGSLVTTSSFNSFTASYTTGSFTGSFTGSLLGTATTASYAIFNPYIVTIGTRIYTDDTSITAGFKGYKHVGYNANIVKTRTIANTSGSIDINVKRSGTTLGTISLSNQSASLDTTLAGWTTQLNTDDLLEFHVSQSSTYITDISIFIDIQARQ